MTKHNYLGSKISTRSTLDAVSLDQMRDFLRVDSDTLDNGLLELIRDAATQAVEAYTNRALLTCTVTAHFKQFTGNLFLPFGNVQSVSSIKYRDASNVQQTISSSNYTLAVSDTADPFISVLSSYTQPTSGTHPLPIEVKYVAGYTSAATIPGQLTIAILNLCADYYDNRTIINSKEVTSGIKHLLEPYRLYNFY